MTPQDINQLIRERRTIYPQECTGEKIDDQIIWQFLENANWAPTHGKTEPWRFFVFASDEAKYNLGEFLAKSYEKLTPPEKFKKDKPEKLRRRMKESSHIAVIVAKINQNPKIPEIEDIEAVACAVQNIQLSATAYGLASYWGTGVLAYAEETKEELGLGKDEKVLGFLYLGVPKPNIKKDGVRKPIQDKVEWL